MLRKAKEGRSQAGSKSHPGQRGRLTLLPGFPGQLQTQQTLGRLLQLVWGWRPGPVTRANRGGEWLTDNCQRPQRLPTGAHVTRLGLQNSLGGAPTLTRCGYAAAEKQI